MIYNISHRTTYEYSDTVSLSQHFLRLRPRQLPLQDCSAHETRILPAPSSTDNRTDYFGNRVTFITVEVPHQKLEIISESRVSILQSSPPNASETPSWNSVRDLARGAQIGSSLEASEFIFDSPLIKVSEPLAEYAASSFPKGRPILEAVRDLTQRIHGDFKFDPKATAVSTPLEKVFQNRRGVCQDFAHVEIGCLRSLGLPARYVSGYLETDPPPGQERLAGTDASHAWISFYCHSLGWIDIDPTNNIIPGVRHITVAHGRDYNDVSPVRGVILGAGEHKLRVAVDVVACSSLRSGKAA
jgi:transglutaminase-like putative cysteine protease